MLGTPRTKQQQEECSQQTLHGIAGKRWAQRRDRRFRYSSSILPSWCTYLGSALEEFVAMHSSVLLGLSILMWFWLWESAPF